MPKRSRSRSPSRDEASLKGLPIEQLLLAGADGNRAHRAAACGAEDCLRDLHKLGAAATLAAADSNGWTPAHLAAEDGHEGCLRVLHELGAAATLTAATKIGLTPAHFAAENGHAGCLRVLYDLGAAATLAAADSINQTLAHLAVKNEQPSADDELQTVTSRTREERDAEHRADAVNLDASPAAKRANIGSSSTSAAVAASGSDAAVLATTSAAAAGSDVAVSSAAVEEPAVTSIVEVEGLAAVVKNLPSAVREAACAWCEETDTASMHLVVELNKVDAFVNALRLKKSGNNEQAVRQRLAALSQS